MSSQSPPITINGENALFRRPTQARGIAKFEKILDAADELIIDGNAEELSLYDIAEKAGVAVGSVYHFFPSKHAVLIALVERYDNRFAEIVNEPLVGEGQNPRTWQDILWLQVERSREYLNNTPAALNLILGPGQTWATRQADVQGDDEIAQSMASAIEDYFQLPQSPAPKTILFNAIRILEGLWGLSFQRHGTVTDEMAEETFKAITAYLRLYWPEYLPAITTSADTEKA